MQSHIESRARVPRPAIRLSAWSNYFFLFISWAILSPYLQLYLKDRGVSPSRIGLLLGCFELAGVAGPMLIGRVADRRTAYRGLLAACLLVTLAAFIPLELTTFFPVYLGCILLMGFAYRATVPLLDSLVSRLLTDPARQYGPLRAAGSVGFITVSLLLQFTGLVSGDSSRAILVAFAITAACAAAAVTALPNVRGPQVVMIRRPARLTAAASGAGGGFDRKFWAVIGVVFLGRFGIGAYYSFFSLYLKHAFPGSGVSLFWAIGAVAEIATMAFSGRLMARWGIRAMLTVSLVAISVRLCLFVVAPSLAVLAAAQLLHALTFGTFHTAAMAYVSGATGQERRGAGMAVYNALGIGLPSFLASTIGGALIEAHGFTALFLSYATVPLLGVLVLAVFGGTLLPHEVPGKMPSHPVTP
jgi:MFS transporter, PPP family, 3-phenylpropionic acid transporter